nr:unnamed protein product [Spirometra erinaceieuropaei]
MSHAVSGITKSPPKKQRPHLSCLHSPKRPIFDIDQFDRPSTTNDVSHQLLSDAASSRYKQPQFDSGSATTLDDASSIAEQGSCVSTASKMDSPNPSNHHKTSNPCSEGDLTNTCSADESASRALATLTITNRESIYVRTLFRYDPAHDRSLSARGLAFEHGDILFVVNASDPEWWQARYAFPVNPPSWATPALANHEVGDPPGGGGSPKPVGLNNSHVRPAYRRQLGIIPSQRRMERRQRLQAKRVQFIDRDVVIDSPWTSFLTANSAVTSSEQHSAGSPQQRFFGNNGSREDLSAKKGSSSSLSTAGYPTTPGAYPYSNGDSMSMGGTLERKKKSGPFSILKRFSSRRGQKNIERDMKTKSISLEDVKDPGSTMSRTYEIVHPVTLKMARPLILFGPLKELITEQLLASADFATCIQHTSRPPMPHEVDGVDFHFVASKAAMETELSSGKFLDAVIVNGHFFATSIESVAKTLQSGKICILDTSVKSLYRLEAAGLHPISILVKPETVMQWRDLQRRLTVDQARRMFEACLELEAEHWYTFTSILNLDTLPNVVNAVHRVLTQHRGPSVWLPVNSRPLQSDYAGSSPSRKPAGT